MISSLLREARQFRASLTLYARLLPYIRAEWRPLLLTGVAMLAATLVTLVRPWPLQVIVDSVLGARPAPAWITAPLGESGQYELLAAATVSMILVLLLGLLAELAQKYFSELLGQRMVLELRCDLYAKLQRLSLRFHDRSEVGDLIYRLTTGAAALQHIVTYGFLPLAIQFLTAAVIATTIFLLDVRLGFAALAIVPFLVVWTAWSSEGVKRRSRSLAGADRTLYATVSEVLGAIRAVKSFAMEDVEQQRFATRARASQEAYVQVMTLSTAGGLVTQAIAGLGTAAIVFLAALAILRGELTVGELLVLVAYVQALYGPITYVASSAMVIQRSAASIELVVQLLHEDDEHAAEGRRALRRVAGRVRYQNVSFGYDETRLALNDVNVEILPGEMVAFVGRSGAGKTSLLSLLPRFYSPLSGRILLDGVDIATLDVQWLRRQIALVLQDPIVFSSSLAENIAYGRPDATRDEIIAASQAAGLHDFISDLPDGYDTTVGERGVRFSGGQRQRLSIARAFLKDAPILILDEPTSNLDAITERHIFESLQRLAYGRTTLVIAHRLATVQRADRIVVLDQGRLVEQGTHRDLVVAGGFYSRLYQDQLLGEPATSRVPTSVW